MTATSTATYNRGRRGSRPIHLWRCLPDGTVVRQVSDVARIDRRTAKGRQLTKLHAELHKYVIDRNGRDPNVLEVEFIAEALQIKSRLIDLDYRANRGDLSDQEFRCQVIPLRNAYRHCLDAIGMAEELDVQRARTEANLAKVYR